ncbi:globin family protein [Sphingomonas sp. 1P06PA]|uniref:globin family protein n=1 Tax=Sphingomonas sp. 1P06PA TaxID=554121 RepID=UPI0039A7005E
MSPAQIDLVHNSFKAAAAKGDEIARRFYDQLFTIAPDTRPLFGEDMTEQRWKLLLTLGNIVFSLDDLELLVPSARALAVRHVRYGVTTEHYDAVGAALIAALGETLGTLFTPPVRAAWEAAYGLLATTMIEAAEQRLREVPRAA